MSKLFNLYRNEMAKVLRRPVLYIMGIIMLALIVGVSFLLKEVDQFNAFEPLDPDLVQQEIDIEREHYTILLENTEEVLLIAEENDEEMLPSTMSFYLEYGQAKAELNRLEWIENHRELYGDLGSMGRNILTPYTQLKAKQYTYERKPADVRTPEDTAQYLMLQATLPAIEARFNKATLVDLIEMMNSFRDLAPEAEGADQDISRKVNAYAVQLARNGASGTKILALSEGYRRALQENADASEQTINKQQVFLPSELSALEDNIKIYEYRANVSGGDPISNMAANIYFYLLVSFAAFIIGILVIIVAGSQISSERSSGSIKSLILSPVKRWKIVTAKLLASISVLLIFITLSWLICSVSMRLILGHSLQPYLYVLNGSVRALPSWLYGLFTAGLQNIGSLFFMLFAFMLSSVGMSTAAAVGISMGIRFGAQPLVFLLTRLLPHATWMRFLPFQHFDLQHHVLPLDFAAGGMDMSDMLGVGHVVVGRSSLTFSLVWLLALSIVMLATAYDTFLRKDL